MMHLQTFTGKISKFNALFQLYAGTVQFDVSFCDSSDPRLWYTAKELPEVRPEAKHRKNKSPISRFVARAESAKEVLDNGLLKMKASSETG